MSIPTAKTLGSAASVAETLVGNDRPAPIIRVAEVNPATTTDAIAPAAPPAQRAAPRAAPALGTAEAGIWTPFSNVPISSVKPLGLPTQARPAAAAPSGTTPAAPVAATPAAPIAATPARVATPPAAPSTAAPVQQPQPAPRPSPSAAPVAAIEGSAAATAARDLLVARLRAQHFTVTQEAGGVVRARGRVEGYNRDVDIFVPPTYRRDAKNQNVNLHLHGFLDGGGSNVEASVFARNDFAGMLTASRSTGTLVVPESHGEVEDYKQFSGRAGARVFNTFMTNLASTMDVDRFAHATLTTHSGSGWIGDSIVLNTRLGEDVRYRGHFDDGYGSNSYQQRVDADRAILARGGSVYSIGNADTTGATLNNAAWWQRTHHRDPEFSYVRNSQGKVIATYVVPSQRAPSVRFADLARSGAPTDRAVTYNVTWAKNDPQLRDPHNPRSQRMTHFAIMDLLPNVWGIAGQR